MRTLAATALSLLLLAGPAAAWVDDDDRGAAPEPPDPPEPAGVVEPMEPAAAVEPTEVTDPAAAPQAAPEGVYYVTETYVANVVVTDADRTTYATVTQDYSPGTYARVLETVATGTSSSYDGAAFNGRAALTDGRAVAGTYYEDYIRTADGFVAVNIVFFQDDSQLFAAPAPAATPEPPAATAPAAPEAPTTPEPAIVAMPPDVADRPIDRGPDLVVITSPQASVPSPEAPAAAPPSAPTEVALMPVEVIRGRVVRVPVRASWSGGPLEVTAWRVTSTDFPGPGPRAGSGAGPMIVAWDRMPPAGGGWPISLLLTVRGAGIDPTDLPARLDVGLRSPALLP